MVMGLLVSNIIIFIVVIHNALASPCDILGGRNELILDVTESIGQDYNQQVHPEVLPIEGDPTSEIELVLSDRGKKRFTLKEKSLVLTGPLDRDAEDQSTILFEITCEVRSTSRRKNIPVVVRIQDLNDNPPEFIDAPYEVTLREDSKVRSPIFKGIRAADLDSGRNGQVEYHIINIVPADNPNLFNLRFPHQGVVFLESYLDYEKSPVYYLTIEATDLATNSSERLHSTTTLTIRVEDIDDQDPIFDTAAVPPSCPENITACVPQYRSSITEGEVSGVLDIYPGRIHAKDLDSLGATIIYSFESGYPTNYNQYFSIDPRTAVINQERPVRRSQIQSFEINVQALERTARQGKAIAKLLINVEDVDTSPPKLIIPSFSGRVLEASAPGTPVLLDDDSRVPFTFSVTDHDIEPGEIPPNYVFELTTSAFKVDSHGVLRVDVPNLDRDPPSLAEHTFQVIAREDKEGGVASAPVSITVKLLDINDNPPMLPVVPTVRVSAGVHKRKIITLQATDPDEGQNARIRYELLSGDKNNFSIDPTTGDLFTLGDISAGEEFLLSVKAIDSGGLSTEGFVKVFVSRGPNTSGPLFTRTQYSAMIPEDIPHGGSILAVKASDPDGDSTYFSITEGNDEKSFAIDTLTGQIIVVAPLDRENKDQYSLVITAEDSDRKSSTAKVYIKITDVNDEVPTFMGEPFSFRVDEGLGNATVGFVKAKDEDLGKFGEVVYSIEKSVNEDQFNINAMTGRIFTKTSLDYEKEQVHYLSVVAKDRADDPQSSTTSVTILVNDISDEPPYFPKEEFSVNIFENAQMGSLLLTVKAMDPDTKPIITYKLLEGDSTLFKVAPDTGRLTLAGKLDFEIKKSYQLVIGTEEGIENIPKSRTSVNVNVEDVNDETPELLPLHTTTFPKMAPIHTLLINVSAFDKDGSSPNNQVAYKFTELEGDAAEYFSIDSEKGEVRLKKSLAYYAGSELTVRVTAMDTGVPPLWTSGEFRVLLLEEIRIDAQGANSFGVSTNLVSSPRFPKDHFEIQVKENIPVGQILVKVPMVNMSASISCSIVSGNEDAMFDTKIGMDGNCKVSTLQKLDYEIMKEYNLTLALHPTGMNFNLDESSILSKASIEVTVLDVNDNSPTFLLENFDILKDDPQSTILSYALQSYPIDTKVIELKALDFDSGNEVEYKLLPESNRGNYFSVDSKTGRVYTKRKLLNVPSELQPFNLSLIAKDQPGMSGMQHSTSINVIIPVIEELHRSVLVLDSPKSEIDKKIHFLQRILSESTGETVQIEFVRQSRKESENGLKTTSQVWFHLLESGTWQPIPPSKLREEKQKALMLEGISSSLDGIKALRLVSPSEVNQIPIPEEKSPILEDAVTANGKTEFDLATMLQASDYILLIALLIIIFVICAIIALCIEWSKYSKKWNRADKTVMLFQPPLEPAGSIIDTISKEYEVQVLHMSVPVDEDSVHETPQPDLNSTRQFCLDNVSYISKSQTGREGSSSAGSSGQGTPKGVFGSRGLSRWSPETPQLGYDPYSGEIDPAAFQNSISNSNVMFGRKEFTEPSPVETTTEL